MSDALKRYGNTKFDTIKAAFDAHREAVRKHDPETSEETWDRCEQWVDAVFGDDVAAENEALRAEVERLREALEAIALEAYGYEPSFESAFHGLVYEKARAALSGEGE